jgi:Asp-tRNA(Asn)/Glu-tRNA(Gln) amidotransferase A subunit family amidase
MLAKVYESVDMVVTPTCAAMAPKIDDAKTSSHGRSDLTSSSAIMRYIFLANLCGNPAVSFPVGYAKATGLPIGIQFIADM